MRLPKPNLSLRPNRTAVIALVMAVGMIAAFSTFAAAPGSKKVNQKYGTHWESAGRGAVSCQLSNPVKPPKTEPAKPDATATEAPAPGGATFTDQIREDKCFLARNDKSLVAGGNHTVKWQTKELQAGIYRFDLSYRNYGGRVGQTDYKYHLKIFVNGQKVDEDRLPVRVDRANYSGVDLELKNGKNTIAIEWDNDKDRPKQDIDVALAWRQISVDRLKKQPPEYAHGKQLDAMYARDVLKHGERVRLWSGAKQSLEAAARGECSPVPAANSCVKMKSETLQSLSEISTQEKFTVTSLTTGTHVTCSNHYEGRGIDLINYEQNGVPSRSLLDKFAKYGAEELLGPGDPGHDGHLHAAWNGSHGHCAR